MAKGNLSACLAEVLTHEGGWADHLRDPGGATMKGVTLGTFRRFFPGATKAQLRNINDAQIERIYRAGYWTPLRGDDLPKGPDLAVFDFGVNSGVSRSAKYTQNIVGVAQDGQIGPVTLEAIRKVAPRDLVKTLCARRLGFVQSLKIWSTFGKGWSRRIASVEAKSLSWVSSRADLEKDARDARNKSTGAATGAAGAGAGGVADQAEGVTGMPIGVVIAIVVVIAGIFIIRSVINAQRAKALSAAAKEA